MQSFGAYEAVVETGDVILAEHGLARSLFIYFCLPPTSNCLLWINAYALPLRFPLRD